MAIINKIDKELILLPPKTGTVSVESIFKTKQGKFEPYSRRTCDHIHMYLQESIHFYSIDDIENWKIYQTARNPFNRALSGFLHARRIHPPLRDMTFESFLISLKEHINLLPNSEPQFIREALQYDGTIPERSSRGARFFVSQVSWSSSNCTYIKLENGISDELNQLSDGLNLPELPHRNRSRFTSSKEEMYTEQAKDIVRELYENDFSTIGYSTEWV